VVLQDSDRPTVAFKTVGCRLNQAETAQMAARFEAAGYAVVSSGDTADVYVVHTCTITQRAEKDCERAVRAFKRRRPDAVAVLAGCAVEVNGQALRQRSGADLTVGQSGKLRLPEIIAEQGLAPGCLCPDRSSAPVQHDGRGPAPIFGTTRALVKVQDGCDFRCAYCIVPSARHAPRSRAFGEIVDEVKSLADRGYREVVLTGANVGCYRDGARGLVDILAALEQVDGILRTRVSSIEVTTIEREVVDFMASRTKLCEYLHLPLQSGDDDVLARMGRRYTVSKYLKLAEYAVERIPRLGLGTDVLVGLPGETEAAFRNTLRVLEALPFTNLHVFPYSKRDGTRAAAMTGQVPEAEKKRRVTVVKELGGEKRDIFARGFLGQEASVLVERSTPNGAGRGWTREYVDSVVAGRGNAVNQVLTVSVTGYDEGSLRCR